MQLSCPVCQDQLTQEGNTLSCPQNHSFDAARQGYWNLLLAHKKRSKDPGDNPEMVNARRDFLALGFYQPLSDHINALAVKHLKGINAPNILDMGCGEGYYTARLYEALTSDSCSPDILGIDISKHAVKAACSQTKNITWAVASGAQSPVPDASLDMQLVLFSRLMPQALATPMKDGAILIVAWPAENHLIELRQRIYAEVRESKFEPLELLSGHFETLATEIVTHPFQLNSPAQINALLAMTPHGQRLKADVKQALCNLPELSLTLSVNLAVLTKRATLSEQ